MRTTDHQNLDLTEFHRQVIQKKANGRIIWQPRIICWYDDRQFTNTLLPDEYEGLDIVGLYQKLGCSNRIYDFCQCIEKIYDSRVRTHERKLSPLETKKTIETPIGTITTIIQANTSNGGEYPKKWFIAEEKDMKVMQWLEESCEWRFNYDTYDRLSKKWKGLGLPTLYLPRPSVLNLYNETMGVEQGVLALYDYPDTCKAYFKTLSESHHKLIQLVNESPVEIINFGDNIDGSTLSPTLFETYVLPEYHRRADQLHSAGKFVHAHWDGNMKSMLPFAKQLKLDGLEAITPLPQGDVTLEEMKEALGDSMFLLDGIAAILFNKEYPVEQLLEQAEKLINYFAPNLILGISDEMSSTGDIHRIKQIGQLVDNYNATK